MVKMLEKELVTPQPESVAAMNLLRADLGGPGKGVIVFPMKWLDRPRLVTASSWLHHAASLLPLLRILNNP